MTDHPEFFAFWGIVVAAVAIIARNIISRNKRVRKEITALTAAIANVRFEVRSRRSEDNHRSVPHATRKWVATVSNFGKNVLILKTLRTILEWSGLIAVARQPQGISPKHCTFFRAFDNRPVSCCAAKRCLAPKGDEICLAPTRRAPQPLLVRHR